MLFSNQLHSKKYNSPIYGIGDSLAALFLFIPVFNLINICNYIYLNNVICVLHYFLHAHLRILKNASNRVVSWGHPKPLKKEFFYFSLHRKPYCINIGEK